MRGARENHWTTGYIALPILKLHKRRVLPVLDNLEVLLEEGKVLGGCSGWSKRRSRAACCWPAERNRDLEAMGSEM
jgi:hypothetical protein